MQIKRLLQILVSSREGSRTARRRTQPGRSKGTGRQSRRSSLSSDDSINTIPQHPDQNGAPHPSSLVERIQQALQLLRCCRSHERRKRGHERSHVSRTIVTSGGSSTRRRARMSEPNRLTNRTTGSTRSLQKHTQPMANRRLTCRRSGFARARPRRSQQLGTAPSQIVIKLVQRIHLATHTRHSAKRKEFKVWSVRSSGRAPPDNAEASSLSYLHDASSTKPNTPGNHRASSVQHPKSLTRAHSQAWDKETQKPTLQSATAMPSVSTESNQKLLDESRNPPEPGG